MLYAEELIVGLILGLTLGSILTMMIIVWQKIRILEAEQYSEVTSDGKPEEKKSDDTQVVATQDA